MIATFSSSLGDLLPSYPSPSRRKSYDHLSPYDDITIVTDKLGKRFFERFACPFLSSC